MKKLFFIETETKHTKHENFDKVLKTKEYAVKEEEKLSPFMIVLILEKEYKFKTYLSKLIIFFNLDKLGKYIL